MEKVKQVYQTFIAEFATTPRLFRAPGRVNLIGEHTDYNEGFVLPVAIEHSAYLAIRPAARDLGTWISLDFKDFVLIADSDDQPMNRFTWANYLLGVVVEFKKLGHQIPAFDLVLGSDIPIGAGLSSSAAVESVMALAVNELCQLGMSRVELAHLVRRAENQFIGVQCGIMDMYTSLNGRKGHAIKLDCRSLEAEYVPLDLDEFQMLIIDSSIRHELAASEYNVRKAECQQAVDFFQRKFPEVKALRDVTTDMVIDHGMELPTTIIKRCRFILEENRRVEKACYFLGKGDLYEFGQQMYLSHQGLSYDYEVSNEQMDYLQKFGLKDPMCIGSRMFGGGFGGCTINLISNRNIPKFIKIVQEDFLFLMKKKVTYFIASSSDGASEIKIPNEQFQLV